MDLKTIGERVGAQFYTTLEMFAGAHLVSQQLRGRVHRGAFPTCNLVRGLWARLLRGLHLPWPDARLFLRR